MSDQFDRGVVLNRAGTRAAIDEGLRAYMLRVYNYMVTGLALTVLFWGVSGVPRSVPILATGFSLNVDVFEPDVSPLAIQGPEADELVRRAFGQDIADTGRRFLKIV